ncbi:hypothetical protein F5Y16DRAFT_396310 [Xylariaceae sp. FL0255]|nr:hypothetical protein F5Y16DRAFT_396310 [Xylariaceae sp. FL0255]
MRCGLITILAATSAMALPIVPRQIPGVGSATAPLSSALSTVGQQAGPALSEVEAAADTPTDTTTPGEDTTTPEDSSSDSGLGSLEGILGRILWCWDDERLDLVNAREKMPGRRPRGYQQHWEMMNRKGMCQ